MVGGMGLGGGMGLTGQGRARGTLEGEWRSNIFYVLCDTLFQPNTPCLQIFIKNIHRDSLNTLETTLSRRHYNSSGNKQSKLGVAPTHNKA